MVRIVANCVALNEIYHIPITGDLSDHEEKTIRNNTYIQC